MVSITTSTSPSSGLFVPEQCESRDDCSGEGFECCGRQCCPKMIFDQIRKSRPCSSDTWCRAINLGQYCCETDSSSKKFCCDEV